MINANVDMNDKKHDPDVGFAIFIEHVQIVGGVI